MTTTTPDRVSIRPAERADLLAVYRIERTSFPQPWPFQAFEEFLGEPGFLVAVDAPATVTRGSATGVGEPDDGSGLPGDGGDVYGYVVADVETDFGRTMGHVKDLAVAPGHRGRGVGTRLLTRALSVLLSRGTRRAKLEVRVDNRPALALYEQFGFAPNHVVPGYYEDGQDALLLVADLTEARGVLDATPEAEAGDADRAADAAEWSLDDADVGGDR